MGRPSSRLSRSRSGRKKKKAVHDVDMFEVKKGERNAERNTAGFIAPELRENKPMRLYAAEAAERRQDNERRKAEKARKEIQKRQKNGAQLNGQVFDLTGENDVVEPASPPPVADDEKEDISDDSDFESPAPSARNTAPRKPTSADATDDIEEFATSDDNVRQSSRDASTSSSPKAQPELKENASEVIELSSDDEAPVQAPRSSRSIMKPATTRASSRPRQFGVLNVNDPMFSNPNRRPGTSSSDLLKGAKGRDNRLRARISPSEGAVRKPLADATSKSRHNRTPRKSGYQQMTLSSEPATVTPRRSRKATKRPERTLWSQIIANGQENRKRQRLHAAHDGSGATSRLEPESIDLDGDDSDDGYQTPPRSSEQSSDRRSAIDRAVRRSGGGFSFGSLDVTPKGTRDEPKNARLRSLTKGENALWEALTQQPQRRKQMAHVKCANIKLLSSDFKCLRGYRWLNDEIMNGFVALINERNKAHFAKADETGSARQSPVSVLCGNVPQHNDEDTSALFARPRPRTHVFNSFFFTRLTGKGYDYQGVRRWPKRANVTVAELDLIAFPINLDNFHWVLAFIDMRSQQFVYCDSMLGHDSHDVLMNLKRWLKDEVLKTRGAHALAILGIDDWPCIENPNYLPEQKDAGSCGVFSMYTAEYLEAGKRPDFEQKHIRILRQRMAIFLKKNSLPKD